MSRIFELLEVQGPAWCSVLNPESDPFPHTFTHSLTHSPTHTNEHSVTQCYIKLCAGNSCPRLVISLQWWVENEKTFPFLLSQNGPSFPPSFFPNLTSQSLIWIVSYWPLTIPSLPLTIHIHRLFPFSFVLNKLFFTICQQCLSLLLSLLSADAAFFTMKLLERVVYVGICIF